MAVLIWSTISRIVTFLRAVSRDHLNFGFGYGFGAKTAREMSFGLVSALVNRVLVKLQQ